LSIPLSVLSDRTVSVLEIIVEYLKDSHHLSYHEIAVTLNRDDRTVWTAYNRAKTKRQRVPFSKDSAFLIPISVFTDRSLSIFEILVEFCHDSLQLKYSQIARITERDDRTVWTAYNRAKLKRGKK